ncbi:malate:quinone oxidoreductase [Rhodococcus sp. NPDC056743]|uniref:malate:quinone oxidoreductase n=1 Tax=Rhodococcus sp. NPDC056743 TaxID=3345934 RepID=UPI00366D2238
MNSSLPRSCADQPQTGQSLTGAPPMSMPHLNTRVVDGSRPILLGPYAESSPKFLKKRIGLGPPRIYPSAT